MFKFSTFRKKEFKANAKSEAITSLAPRILESKEDLERIKPYLAALQKTIGGKDIYNIALTGAYGSGKSTILRTFQSRHETYNYINISLASFKDEIPKTYEENFELTSEKEAEEHLEPEKLLKREDVKKKNIERLIELSILQQLFYHVRPSEIPDSRFKRIQGVKEQDLRNFALAFIFWATTTFMMFRFNLVDQLNPNSWTYSFYDLDFTSLILFVIFFLGIFLAIPKAVRVLKKTKINKINVKGEIELGKDMEKSILNEHLDEILYFFENTEYNVIIFEDLDRFRNTEVFTKLREINLLLNNSKLIKRDIVFVYAIRDDMFQDMDRTKFFDYIIPVIPFINPSNATDQLFKILEENGLKKTFTEEFIDDVVTFIDDIDMRLLTNIFHEYNIYRKSLGKGLIQDNLLAMIVYKNLYPEDFVNLPKRKGNLYRFISKKEQYIGKLVSDIQEGIKRLNTKIAKSEIEEIESIEQLKFLYVGALQNKFPNAVSLKLKSGYVEFGKLFDEDNFLELLQIKNLHYENQTLDNSYRMYRRNPVASGISFAAIEESVNPESGYSDRLELINNKSKENIDGTKARIESLLKRKDEIQSWDLKQIFEEIDIESHLNGFSNSRLMRNLLLNGYINENYSQYISLFHEGNITKEDYEFERNVKSGVSSKYDYKLYKIKNLVKRIPVKYFKKKSTLNYDLLSFLLINRVKYSNRLNLFLNQITGDNREEDESYELFRFMDVYLNRYKTNKELQYESDGMVEVLIKEVCSRWTGFWGFIVDHSGLQTKDVEKFLRLIIKHVNLNDIPKLNGRKELSNYIDSDSSLLNIFGEEEHPNVGSVLQILNIKFKKLEAPNDKTKKLFDFIYKNNHYEINTANIKLIQTEKSQNFNETEFNRANYTSILDSESQELKSYLSDNIVDYVTQVLLIIEGNEEESENTVKELLNNDSIGDSLKEKLIKKVKFQIGSLKAIEKATIKETLINHSKVKSNWRNVYEYYIIKDNTIDNNLVNFLNQEGNYNELKGQKISSKVITQKDNLEDFTKKIILCNELSNDSYDSLVNSTIYTWKSLDISNLARKKIVTLIQGKIIQCTKYFYDKLKTDFANLHIKLVEENFNKFLESFDEFEKDENDFILLFKSSITYRNKVAIFQKAPKSVTLNNAEIMTLFTNITAEINSISLDYPTLESMFKNSPSIKNKIKVLNANFGTLNKDQIKSLIGKLPHEYRSLLKKQHKPKLPNTTENVELLDKLKNGKQIIRYEFTSDGQEIKAFANYT